jgi:general secretion pathway protein D
MNRFMRIWPVFAAVLVLAACEESLRPERSDGVRFADQNQWSTSLNQYRSQLAKDPDNAEALQEYYATVEKAEEFFILRARRLAQQNDLNGAEGLVSQGLVSVPESNLLRDELASIRDMKAARGIYRDAELAARMGRHDRAMELTEQALAKDPNYRPAVSLLQTLFEVKGAQATVKPIRLQTGAPVSLSFQNADFKEAALALGRAYGVNMIFDADLSTRAISIYADKVDFSQAFQLLLKSNGSFYRRLGENTVIIARDTPDKRAEYEDYVVRTFFIQSGNAQAIAETLALTLGLRTVSVNEADNSITVRDTAPRILLADQLINSNDSEPAEVLLEVEVLEVNRTKSERLGLDFGSEISIKPDVLPGSDVFPLNDTYASAAVTLPATTFRYFKQDVDARTLASPRIRAVDGREAVFHVGDQVPLRATEIIDADGQVRNTFEYRDIGIKLNATPEVRLDSSVVVNLRLEVSSLGQNLGTAEDPAYSIGTRRVETRMTLDDGETAIIGGLIRDEERDTVQKVPGLGNIPGVGKLSALATVREAALISF